MPKLKLRNWQFELICSSVRKKSRKELVEIHKILSDYHGKDFSCALWSVREISLPFLQDFKKQ